MKNTFDAKFGPSLIEETPRSPGVYLFYDAAGVIIYVGKAANLRRRLLSYRRAGRRKKERKMRAIVRAASRLVFETCESEKSALLRENMLIQRHRPLFNIAGAYSFLYPFLGIRPGSSGISGFGLCLTTLPERLLAQDFELFGAYRCRMTVKNAFLALESLFSYLGHADHAARRAIGATPFSRITCFRRIDPRLEADLRAFLRGESLNLLDILFAALLEKSPARRDAPIIQADFAALLTFFEKEASALRQAMQGKGLTASMITQAQRDPLFI